MDEFQNILKKCFSSKTSGLVSLSVIGLVITVAVFGSQWRRDWQARDFERQCRALRNSRDWSQLASVSETWTRNDPGRANAWLFRAEVAESQRQYVAAAEFLFQVPPQDPKSIPAAMKGATILLSKANRPIEGVDALEKLLQREPRIAEAHHHLIQYYALTLQRDPLMRQIRFAIAHKRETPEAYVYLFLVDTLRLSNGVEMNNRWLEAYPDHETFLVAKALHMEERREAARRRAAESKDNPTDISSETIPDRSQTLAELFRKYPHNLELMAYEIEQSLLVGEIDRVITVLSQAPPEIDEDNRFWRFKGQVHEDKGQIDEAELAYRMSVKMNPLDWRTWNSLAKIERLKGRFSEVNRLQNLVKSADKLRHQVRGLDAVENIGNEWLLDLLRFAQEAGDDQIVKALSQRIGRASPIPALR